MPRSRPRRSPLSKHRWRGRAGALGTLAVVAASFAAAGVPASAQVQGRARVQASASRADGPADGPAGGPTARQRVGGPLMASQGIVVHYPAHGATPLPKVPASAFVLANARTGAVLAARDAHGLYPPASTLKVLTAITMLPRLKPDAMVKASKLAVSVQPNVVGLVRGREYRVADLFRALLLISANDAAVALTQASGSFTKGMALINAEAHRLQAYDVVAKVPNGLPRAGQVVSAYDLALIGRQALEMPSFMKYDSTLAAKFPLSKRKKTTLVNQNYLLTRYKGGIGGKIGWTMKAEATYIGMARRHGVTLIVTIMHCQSLMEILSAEKLLTWGFANLDHVKPVGTLVSPLRLASHRTSSKLTGSRGSGAPASLAGASRSSSAGGAAIAAAIAALICIAIVGFTLIRRRQATSKR